MNILIVCSGNNGRISPFVKEQANSLMTLGMKVSYFLIMGKGLIGYLKNYNKLNSSIKQSKPDIIHAHFGLSGLLCVLQRKIPVVITFHGSDINQNSNLRFSKIAMKLAEKQIFVSQKLLKKANINKGIVIPCGIDTSLFYPRNKIFCRQFLKLDSQKKYILFSSAFNNEIKNFELAKSAVNNLNLPGLEIIELKGYNREEVAILLNAVDVFLMTSFSEGSPQIVKEALACNVPIVSTDVGDVKELIENIDGCYITSYDPAEISARITNALKLTKEINGREKVVHLDLSVIAEKIAGVYLSVLK